MFKQVLAIDVGLQVLNQLLLLFEDVLQLSQGGLHLLQRELVLTLGGLVLGHPGVELDHGVVQEDPLFHQDVALLNPAVGHGLDLESRKSSYSLKKISFNFLFFHFASIAVAPAPVKIPLTYVGTLNTKSV